MNAPKLGVKLLERMIETSNWQYTQTSLANASFNQGSRQQPQPVGIAQ
jgi:hypothetical protein